MAERNYRACFYVSLLLLFISNIIILSGISILISYTVSMPPSNKTADTSSDTFWSKIRGNSEEQSVLIIFCTFLTFGVIVSLFGLLILCCGINCGSKIGTIKFT